MEKTKNLSKQKKRITAKVKLNSFQFIKYAAINSAADRAGNAMNAFIGHNANKLQQQQQRQQQPVSHSEIVVMIMTIK